MIRINLLPPEYLQERRLKKELVMIYTAASLAFLMLATLYFVGRSELTVHRHRAAAVAADVASHQPHLSRIQEYEQVNQAMLELLSDKEIVRTSLPQHPADTLGQLQKLTPRQLRLQTLELKDGTATATGSSSSYQALTAWMQALDQSPRFADVQLRSVGASSTRDSVQGSADARILTFNISWRTLEGDADDI